MALLLAAHGERSVGAVNARVVRLATSLRRREIVREVAIGFIKGIPTIVESARALRASELIVYPMFLSEGYFTRTRLPQLLKDSMLDPSRRIHILPPLGQEPMLIYLILEKLLATARDRGVLPQEASVILLAHGSRTDPASRIAAEHIAKNVRRLVAFRAVRVALLEEAPSLQETASGLSGAMFVFGLFAGEGMHGASDGPRLVQELGLSDAVFVGTVAALDGIEHLVAAAVARAMHGECGSAVLVRATTRMHSTPD